MTTDFENADKIIWIEPMKECKILIIVKVVLFHMYYSKKYIVVY